MSSSDRTGMSLDDIIKADRRAKKGTPARRGRGAAARSMRGGGRRSAVKRSPVKAAKGSLRGRRGGGAAAARLLTRRRNAITTMGRKTQRVLALRLLQKARGLQRKARAISSRGPRGAAPAARRPATAPARLAAARTGRGGRGRGRGISTAMASRLGWAGAPQQNQGPRRNNRFAPQRQQQRVGSISTARLRNRGRARRSSPAIAMPPRRGLGRMRSDLLLQENAQRRREVSQVLRQMEQYQRELAPRQQQGGGRQRRGNRFQESYGSSFRSPPQRRAYAPNRGAVDSRRQDNERALIDSVTSHTLSERFGSLPSNSRGGGRGGGGGRGRRVFL